MKWFLSDIHYCHEKVLSPEGPRGKAFTSLDDWQRHILGAINSSVVRGDTLFLVGDVLGVGGLPELQQLKNKINCKDVWLILGNHEPSLKTCLKVFNKNQVRHTFMTKVCGTPTWLSHYAHAYWPSSHKLSYHLYGHNHGQRERTLDEKFPGRRSMEVCPETIFQHLGKWGPISEIEVDSILKSRPGHDNLEFYTQTNGTYE